MSIFTPFKFRYDLFRLGAATRKAYGVSFAKQRREAHEMFRLNHLEPWEFTHFHMSHPDLSLDDKRKFLSYNQTCAIHRELSPRHLRGITNKWMAYNLFSQLGIPTPKVYGFYDPVFGRTPEGRPFRNLDDLKKAINDAGLTEFVVKPSQGKKGNDVTLIIGRRGDSFIRHDGRELSFEELHELCLSFCHEGTPATRGGAIVQERVKQHPLLQKLNPNCTNTIRITTFIANDGTIEPLYTVLKLGRGNSPIDNLDKGSLPVDVDSNGMMLPAQRVYPDRIEVIDDHPDTGERFSGLALPFYREAVEVAVKAQGALSQLRTLGFDVAITERGVSIIEANTWWGHPTQAEMRRGLITDKLREVLDVIIPPM